MIYLLYLILFFVLATVAVLYTFPVFGADPRGERRERIKQSWHSNGKQFEPIEPTKVAVSFNLTKFPEFFRKGDTVPAQPLKTQPISPKDFESTSKDDLFITWLGHSILLIEIGGKRILVDPVFSRVPSPFQFAGNPAFAMTNEYSLENLPDIDIVLLSHDHYDHLDYQTILKLKNKVPHFVAALGVGAHLERWGVATEKIIELDWWETNEVAGLKFTSTPTRHFSGRGLRRFRTLWCGFAIEGAGHNVLYGADSGYGKHFKEIGEKLGPFDFALMECGQYNEMWNQIHAMPEELPQAWKDVNAKTMMPIHWGRFKLAMHPWTEPVERLLAATPINDQNRLITPSIGERFDPKKPEQYLNRWWRE